MKVPFQIGESRIHAVVHKKAPATLTMVNVHNDEITAIEAGLHHLKHHGGRLIELVHPGARLAAFHLEGKKYSFDPNRIFTDAGITATLKKCGRHSAAAYATIKSFATEYLRHFALDQEPVIVALHNNAEGALSINSFLPDGDYGAAVVETHISPRRSQFDFFYVTERKFHDHLKAHDWNVTLQDNAAAPDDGSLSIYFARQGIPYINIEADINHLSEQIEMIQAAREMLVQLPPR